jgi:hypothetical protein
MDPMKRRVIKRSKLAPKPVPKKPEPLDISELQPKEKVKKHRWNPYTEEEKAELDKQYIKFHAEGWTDGKIARELDLPQPTVSVRMRELGLPPQTSKAVKAALEARKFSMEERRQKIADRIIGLQERMLHQMEEGYDSDNYLYVAKGYNKVIQENVERIPTEDARDLTVSLRNFADILEKHDKVRNNEGGSSAVDIFIKGIVQKPEDMEEEEDDEV